MKTEECNFNFRHKVGDQNLVIAIAQDYKTSEVLMVAYMNEEALQKTIETKKAHYWSTSRQNSGLKEKVQAISSMLKRYLLIVMKTLSLSKLVRKAGPAMKGMNPAFSGK